MGEGGCPPDYFLERMTLTEANDYITGQDRRHRQQWDMTRLLINSIASIFTGESAEITFPWDDTRTKEERAAADEAKQAEWDELKRKCDELNERHRNKSK